MSFIEFLAYCQDKKIIFTLVNEQLKVKAPENTLVPEVVEQLRQFKPDIIQLLKNNKGEINTAQPIKRIERQNGLLTSYGQEQLWLLDNVYDTQSAYHFSRILTFTGTLNIKALQAAFTCIVQRHECLRTVLLSEKGVVFQQVNDISSLEMQIEDLSGLDDVSTRESAQKYQQACASRAFDLTADYMIRTQLIRFSEQEHQLIVTLHHIASDGWSLGLLVSELSSLYNQYVNGQPLVLPDLAIQYADYAHWQRTVLAPESFSQLTDYWANKLAGCPELHNLPLDKLRPAQQSFSGSSVIHTLDLSSSTLLKSIAKQRACTLFSVLESLFSILIARYSYLSDVVIGTTVANRHHPDIEGLIGYFVNTVPLRHQVNTKLSFNEYLTQVHKDVIEAFDHQQLPFNQIVHSVISSRSQSYNPLVQIGFVLQNNEIPALNLSGVSCTIEQQTSTTTVFDLQLEVSGSAEGLVLNWQYATALFNRSTIERMARNFELLVANILSQPDIPLEQLVLITPEECRQQLVDWNDTATGFVPDKCIHELFEVQAVENSNAVAAVFDNEQLTYGELNARANRLASYLIQERKVKPDVLVGVCLERSLDMLVAIMAVLKAGGAYVPLDPHYPKARLANILDEANLHTVLTQSKLEDNMPVSDAQAVYIDSKGVPERLQTYSADNIVVDDLTPGHLAYVIYTSGSTGKPKGVMVEHASVINFIQSMSKTPGISKNDRLLAVTSTSFDIHVLELFLPTLFGGELILASEEAAKDANMLLALMSKHQISLMQATPVTWKMLLELDWLQSTPLTVLCGGEALPWSLAKRLLAHPNIMLWNMYGPTETTVWSTLHQVTGKDSNVLIGKPIDNTQCYVLSEELTLLPQGSVGELYIGGEGVTRGYFNRRELTNERFIANPFFDKQIINGSQFIYKTGDLARWLPDGTLECLGRIDNQIKIRGHRVELGDIERQLSEHSGVKEALLVVNDDYQNQQLVSYIVPQPLANELSLENQLAFSLLYFGGDSDDDNKYEFYTNAAVFGDKNGFEAVWTPERHFDTVGGAYPSPAILNAALATITSQIQLRAGSVVLPLHDPVRVAEEWSVVDNLSHGRVGLAIASGWHDRDFVLAPQNYQNRKDVMLAGIDELNKLWQGDSISRVNGSGDIVPISIFPKPVQKQLPLWITAAGNPQTFIAAGRQGAHILTHLLGQSIEELTENIQLYKQALEEHGYDKSQARITLMIHTYIGDDLEQTMEEAKKPFLNYLQGHISLLIPALKGLGLSIDDLSPEDLEEIAAFSYERLAKKLSLIGTPSSTIGLINKIKQAGVNEIACLIDWMDSVKAQDALMPLSKLKALSSMAYPERSELVKHCEERLPQFMIPDAFMFMESFPLTANGKINRKALPKVELSHSSQGYVAARTETEQILCQIWQEVLNVETVGVRDDFFELGGHSLLATKLIANINKAFKVNLPLKTLFNSPSIASLSQQLMLAGSGLSSALVPVSRDQHLLPSFAQQRLWLLDLLEGGSAHYNTAMSLRLTGDLNIQALTGVFNTIVERHEVLRTNFTEDADGQLIQLIRPFSSIDVPVIDISLLPETERESELAELVLTEANKSFDLSADAMLRAQLVKVAADKYVLLITMHHIASDGWSMGILTDEFRALYSAYIRGEVNPLLALDIQYADYAHWQRDWLQGEVLDKQLAYWQQQLAALPIVHSLPLDRARPKIQTFSGATHHSVIASSTAARLNQVCQKAGGTLFMGLHAAFSVLLARYSNQTDIVVGSPIANREQVEVANLIGFFVNTLVLRSNLSANPSFIALLEQSKQILLDAYAHQQVPFEQIVEALQPERSLSHSPLFQVMLVLQNNEEAELELPGLSLSQVEQPDDIAKYDLTLNVLETREGLALSWNYNTDLLNGETIKRLAGHFELLLTGLLDQPQENVFAIDMLPAAEVKQQLIAWNHTAADFEKDKGIHELFQQQAVVNPDAVALVFEQSQLTYGELNARANQLAGYLIQERGIKPETLVGICVERSLDMVVAILGILKAGGAYVPLDPSYPQARLEYMLADANLETVLTQTSLQDKTPLNKAQSVFLDCEEFGVQLRAYSTDNVVVQGSSSDLAYVIYTSGSTGNPKGVMVEHRQLTNFIDSMGERFALGDQDSLLAITSLSFDIHTLELYTPLTCGSKVIIASTPATSEPDRLAALMDQHSITIMQATPSTWKMLINHGWKASHAIKALCGGEALACELKNKLLSCDHVQLWNMYGPTETCVWSLVAKMDNTRSVTIGQPITNTQLMVLSHDLKVVPVGVAGELHIGGVGLARGYLHRADLTAEKFIANPFYDANEPNSSERLYKTGDLVRYLPNGHVEFLGRIDHQVKIRGFRIELGEIEHQILSHDEVNDVVVVALPNEDGDKRLVAYVAHDQADKMLSADGEAQSESRRYHEFIDSLRGLLSRNLPDYMVPSAFVVLKSLPLTPNGKLDRKGLPEPNMSLQQKAYLPPTTDTEILLCQIWQDVLGLERVGITDNFFELGGHSLLAAKAIAHINAALDVDVPLKALFSSASIVQLSKELSQYVSKHARSPITQVSRDDDLPASFAQQQLWLLDKINGGSVQYNLPVAIRLTGELNIAALTQALTTIVKRHESLRTHFVEGSDGQLLQVIRSISSLDVPVTDISVSANGEPELDLAALVAKEASKPFDLNGDLMLRSQLIKVVDQSHILLVTMHHIVSDGWSMGIVINEFSALYNAYVRGEANPLPDLDIQYVDYAHWQRDWLQGQGHQSQLSYWQTQLADLPAVHSLPLDRARPNTQSFSGAIHQSVISSSATDKLNSLCQGVGGTLFMGLHAVFSVLLARYSNQTDIVIGSPVANRDQLEVTNLIGFFMNVVVLRSDLSANLSFTALLEQNKQMLLDAYAHQQVPFDLVVEKLQPERSSSYSPLFQVMLVLQNNEAGNLELSNLSLSSVEQKSDAAQHDLKLDITESAQGLQLDWEYNTDLFNRATIERLAKHFELLLTRLVNAPQESVFTIDMLSLEEVGQQLLNWNDTRADYPKGQCVHELFERQVAQAPNAVAVVFEDKQLTYGELNVRANQLAGYLIKERGVTPDTLVGICVERSMEMVIGVMAILKAGGAYVPLDPSYPSARLEYMLADAGLDTVLTQSKLQGQTPVDDNQAVYLDSVEQIAQMQSYPTNNVSVAALHSNSLAYVIYTSGSTGNPKGAMVEHQGAVNLYDWYGREVLTQPKERVLMLSSLSFDLAQKNILSVLISGQEIVMPDMGLFDSEYILKYINDKAVTTINCAPSVFSAICKANTDIEMPSLRALVLGGEPIDSYGMTAFLNKHPNCQLINSYGPTECTDISLFFRVTELEQLQGIVPIGVGIPNVDNYILDSNNKLVPAGVIGQLHIGGVGLGRGYLNRPDLTADKFISNPFYDQNTPGSTELLYKTGDLVRRLADGNIEFLGRIDHQVKMRGLRIELGEIEHQLLSHDEVTDAVVVTFSADGEDKRLVAYVVHNQADKMLWVQTGEEESDQVQIRRHEFIESLRRQLLEELPDYMVPSMFVVLESLPLTPSGKVDRKGLPVPNMSLEQNTYVAPSTETEKLLSEIWQEVLGVERVGVTDNFFELGGHSLLLSKLVIQINQSFSVNIELRQLFDFHKLKELAAFIDDLKMIQLLTSGELAIDSLSEAELEKYLMMLQEESTNE